MTYVRETCGCCGELRPPRGWTGTLVSLGALVPGSGSSVRVLPSRSRSVFPTVHLAARPWGLRLSPWAGVQRCHPPAPPRLLATPPAHPALL